MPKNNQPFACKFLQATADFAILQKICLLLVVSCQLFFVKLTTDH